MSCVSSYWRLGVTCSGAVSAWASGATPLTGAQAEREGRRTQSSRASRFPVEMRNHDRLLCQRDSALVERPHRATTLWHAQEREVLVLQANGGPLVGMGFIQWTALRGDL